MTLILPTNFANARFVFSVTGIQDHMGFGMGLGPDPGLSATEIAITCRDAAISSGLFAASAMSTGWTFQGVSVTKQLVSGPVVGQNLIPVAGTNPQGSPPANCTILVRKNTALGGRRNRGRCNLPVAIMEEPNVDQAGNITTSVVTIIQNKVIAFHQALTTGGLNAFLLHSHVDDAPTEIVSLQVMNQLATQRRRMR